MRFKALQSEDFKMMADAGCRFILWGFESANQKTLDMLNKGYDIHCVPKNLIAARKAGIWNHLTVMTGFPWEELEDEKRTFNMVKWLMLNDWAASMQSLSRNFGVQEPQRTRAYPYRRLGPMGHDERSGQT